jgi:hypothetical protein
MMFFMTDAVGKGFPPPRPQSIGISKFENINQDLTYIFAPGRG